MNERIFKEIEKNLYQFYLKAGLSGGLNSFESHDFSFVSGKPGTWPNYCFNIQSQDALMGIIAEMKAHKIPPFLILGKATNSDFSETLLSSQGMKLVMQWSAMACELNDQSISIELEDFSIEAIHNRSSLEDFLTIIRTQLMRSRVPELSVFEPFLHDSEMCLYIAKYKGIPVGTSLLYCKDQIAGIYMVAVNEDQRGKGIGKALTSQMLNDAIQKNCKHAILHATKDGEKVYRKFGFEEFGKINIYWLMGKEYI